MKDLPPIPIVASVTATAPGTKRLSGTHKGVRYTRRSGPTVQVVVIMRRAIGTQPLVLENPPDGLQLRASKMLLGRMEVVFTGPKVERLCPALLDAPNAAALSDYLSEVVDYTADQVRTMS